MATIGLDALLHIKTSLLGSQLTEHGSFVFGQRKHLLEGLSFFPADNEVAHKHITCSCRHLFAIAYILLWKIVGGSLTKNEIKIELLEKTEFLP